MGKSLVIHGSTLYLMALICCTPAGATEPTRPVNMDTFYSAAQKFRFTDVARHADNTPKLMAFNEAEDLCNKMGGSLPSAREFTYYAQKNGAKGIVNEDECRSHGKACISVRVNNSDGKPDNFKYSLAGYARPQDHLGLWDFWSSSFDPDNEIFYPFAFDGGTGYFPSSQRGEKMALCVIAGP